MMYFQNHPLRRLVVFSSGAVKEPTFSVFLFRKSLWSAKVLSNVLNSDKFISREGGLA